MPINRLSLSDYHRLSAAEKEAIVRDLAEAGGRPLDGELDELNAEIASLELRYQMSTATMRQRVRDDLLDHTPDICHSQILAELRDRASQAQ